ncbi:hypothetical protein M0805_008256 [Coniferiporia weirii]|nr:hypothetical protein M0805_008256 [Coniferiporia weirii]
MLSKSRTLLFFKMLVLFTLAIGSTALSTLKVSSNVTVDDQNGDQKTGAMPTYSPVSVWNQGANCSHCKARPDPSLALDSTWHDTTANPGADFPTVEISFTGTAVYAFFITGNDIPGATVSLSNLTFTLDGNEAGTFLHVPTSSTDFEFNVPGFSQTGLENSRHKLIISDVGTPNASLILFDFLVYTAEEDETTTTLTSTNPSNTQTITSTKTTLVTTFASTASTDASLVTTLGQSPIGPGSIGSTSPDEPLPTQATSPASQTHPQTGTTQPAPLASFANPSSGITSHFPGPTSSQSASRRATRNVGAIVGGLFGGVTTVILTILAILYYRRRRREREASWIASEFVVSSRHSLASTIVRATPQTRESRNTDFLFLTPDRTNTLGSLRPTLGSSIGQPHSRIEALEVSPQRVNPASLIGADQGQREDSLGMSGTDMMRFDNEKSSGSNGDVQSPGTDDVQAALLDRFPRHGEARLESMPSVDRNDVVLLSQIATLQAEVDRLQSFHQSTGDTGLLISSGASQGDEPPPGYYGGDEASVPRQL